MPVTELGFFRPKPSISITDPSLLANLLVAKQTCEAFTARNSGNKNAVFRWEHCIEDPELIYYVGSWGSVDEHRVEFVNSEDNKRLEGLLAGQVSIDQYFHLELDQSKVDVRGALDGKGVAVIRHFVKPGQRGEVDRLFEMKLQDLRLHLGGSGKVVGGWRIDKEADDKDELVVFVGLESKDQRLDAGETVLGGTEVMKYLERVEVTHAAKLDLGDSGDLKPNPPVNAPN
jgi:hypothetical protein